MKDYKDRNNKDKNNSDLVDFFKELNKANDKIFSKILIRLVKDKQYKLITNLDTNRLNNNYLFMEILVNDLYLELYDETDVWDIGETINFIKMLDDFGKSLDLSLLIGCHFGIHFCERLSGDSKKIEIFKKEVDTFNNLLKEGYKADKSSVIEIGLDQIYKYYGNFNFTKKNMDFYNSLMKEYKIPELN